ncbi:MAG: hypothetical protein IJ551_03235 [Prevotella sp.]|nr:hypothetical protein [Prevotella sp.]
MKKLTARLWMLTALPMLLGLASCAEHDNPVTNPVEPQPQALADYTIIWYGNGGGNLPNDELPAGADAARKTRGVIYDDGHDSRHFTAQTLAQAANADIYI